ncbi:MAG: transposase [Clostridia bacterium]
MMTNLPNRKPNRLKGYDYAGNGAYFITICTKGRKCILSRIPVGNAALSVPKIELTAIGKIVEEHIRLIPGIDKYVIMPNHIHLIVIKSKTEKSISEDIRALKSVVSRAVGRPIWQKSFYDHIIRDEEDYLTKAEYIENNPSKWIEDELYSF